MSELKIFETGTTVGYNVLNCFIKSGERGNKFAFYLFVDGRRVAERWYNEDSTATFRIDNDKAKIYSVIYFLKDEEGKIHSKKEIISPLDIDFQVRFRIIGNKIRCTAITSLENVEFAFYLYLNDEPVRKRGYGAKGEIEFEIGDVDINSFRLKFFIRDEELKIITKNISFRNFEPEENVNKIKNKFKFYISKEEMIIYKKANAKDNKLGKLLSESSGFRSYSKIMSGDLFADSIRKHIVNGFDFEKDGSYKSKYIDGYRLDLIFTAIKNFPSLNFPPSELRIRIKRQCEDLITSLNTTQSNGDLFGDWALHNLIYSVDDDIIYNIDLEGFITYRPIPEWAGLEKITLWINSLIDIL
ncbi:hypothetical protein N8653_02915 [Euryarchaeota archaeon]|nr:hypothetical protein [Euryarchaeota archaeon]